MAGRGGAIQHFRMNGRQPMMLKITSTPLAHLAHLARPSAHLSVISRVARDALFDKGMPAGSNGRSHSNIRTSRLHKSPRQIARQIRFPNKSLIVVAHIARLYKLLVEIAHTSRPHKSPIQSRLEERKEISSLRKPLWVQRNWGILPNQTPASWIPTNSYS